MKLNEINNGKQRIILHGNGFKPCSQGSFMLFETLDRKNACAAIEKAVINSKSEKKSFEIEMLTPYNSVFSIMQSMLYSSVSLRIDLVKLNLT